MYPADRRGRAVGILLAAGTIGAVGKPLLAAVIEESAGGEGSLLPWIVPILGAAGALVCGLAVSPDPRDRAVVEPAVEQGGGRGTRELLRVPTFRTAVLAGAVGQMVMVGVMGVTPTALDHAHHGGTTISLVISAHIAGMFAFAPLIGRWMDRAGRRAALIGGCATSIVGALLAASEANALVIGAGLVAIGAGMVGHVPGRHRRHQRHHGPRTSARVPSRLHRPVDQPDVGRRRPRQWDRARGGRLRSARGGVRRPRRDRVDPGGPPARGGSGRSVTGRP